MHTSPSILPVTYLTVQNKSLKHAIVNLRGHIIKTLNFIEGWKKNISCDSQIKTPLGPFVGPFKSSPRHQEGKTLPTSEPQLHFVWEVVTEV